MEPEGRMLMDVKLCEECGIPEPFYEAQEWLNNGDIVQRLNHQARMGFLECENLDPLFDNMQQILRIPIDHLIVNIVTRGCAIYMAKMIPKEITQMAIEGKLPLETFIDPICTFCHVLGYGQYDFKDYIFNEGRNDFARLHITHPFSVPEAAGAFAGVVGAVVGGEHQVTYREKAPGLWEFVTRHTEFPKLLKEKIKPAAYRHVDGDVELEKCASCGMPKAFSDYHWYLKKGVIVDGKTSRRMAVLGPELLDVVFTALQSELGEAVPRVVVEAQRRFVKTGFYSVDQVRNEDELRTYLALRGLGNLRWITMGTGGLKLRIDNASCHLMTVGMAQGLFEIALDTESVVDWEFTDNDLLVEVSPSSSREPIPV